jgi:hypothetical protein
MKTFCLDSQKDWDDGICMLLFVAKEAFQNYCVFNLIDA